MRSNERCCADRREFIEKIPLVDCHDHSQLPNLPPYDPITAIIDFYLKSDLVSASYEAKVGFILNETRSLEERWSVLERAWNRARG